MMPVLQVGPVALPLPSLLILLGIWLGLTLAERHTARFALKADQLFNLALIGIVSGLVGARLAYVIRYPQAFAGSPLDVFSRNLGLFDPLIGAVVGVLAAAIYAQRKHLPLLSTLDALTPGLAVFAIALALSHLASGDAYGAPADLPWSFELWGIRRHPTQVYETIAAALVLGYLWPGRNFLGTLEPGGYFLYFITITSAARLVLEGFRGDSVLLPGGFRLAQVIAWIIFGICLYAINRIKSHPNPE
jgi:phosphatidylglycerol:prolipoprotein diacylglycerol transferase